MKIIIIFWCMLLCINSFIECVIYKSNFTDLKKCEISYSRSGDTYIQYYPVVNPESGQENNSLVLDFHFAVLATSDAHILLTESGGSIEVGKEGENTSFISWLDPKPLSIKFISFSTWSDIEAKWYFNCDRSLNEEELNKRRTALERLRRDLLIPYDPLVRPVMNQSTITEVYIGLTLEHLEFDDNRAILDLRGSQWLFLEKSIFQFKSDNSSEKFNTMPNSFGIYFEIKRNSVIYSVVFLLPLVVIALCLLTSFWAPLIGNFKLFLAGLQLFIEIIILLALAHFIPHTTDAIPFLSEFIFLLITNNILDVSVILYGWCLAGSFLSILISLILMKTFSKTQSKPVPHVICKILTKKWVKFFLILPNVGVPEDYGDIDISLSFSNVSRTEDKSLHVWGLLLLAIERLLFMVYSVFVATILTKYVMSCF
ncbi:hypothetical protein ABEB36_008464 [Hypothenemus hampei]|uniref:Farnesoic acid O-methyl transferase domain-containing protein n=1 Tax=Hypothenemus hampei TaxID=57062 RepID=A0ABD1EM02_HYPHA